MTCFLLYFLEYIKTQILISLFAILPNVIAHHSYRQRNMNFSSRFSCETLDLGRDTFLHSSLFHQRLWISSGKRSGKPDEMLEGTFATDKHLIQGE